MNDKLPFGQPDLPRASGVVPVPVATAFRAVADVRGWPAWVPLVLDPVVSQDDEHYLFRVGQTSNARNVSMRLLLRTPVHLVAFENDDGDQLWFRVRPTTGGANVEIVLRPNPQMSRLERLRERRRSRRRAAWVEATLDALAGFLAAQTPRADT